MNVAELITISFAIQGILVALLLFFKKSIQKHSNAIWGFFLILFSFYLIICAWYWYDPQSNFSQSLSDVFLLPLSLFGPLFYCYVRSLVLKKPIGPSDWYHLIPFVLVFANFSRFFFLPLETKIAVNENDKLLDYVWISDHISYNILVILLLGYSVYTLIHFKRHYQQDDEMKNWLVLITSCFIVFAVNWPLYYLLYAVGILSMKADYGIGFSMIFFIGMTTYFGFFHSSVFEGKALKKVFPILKYKNSGLSKQVMNDFKVRLQDEMEKNALYLDSELRLKDLASRLSISRHHASQIINESFGVSFYEYVNQFRIQEAKKLLEDMDSNDLNITDIAFKSGFNNRVSFYNTFRKHFGVTPSEYRNKALAS